MNKLFVRLAASTAIATSLGAPALAGTASIHLTGPGSTNTITNSSWNQFSSNTQNWADVGNWNNQWARSGDVWVSHNTHAGGSSAGSGDAHNSNTGTNHVNITNQGGSFPHSLGGGSGNASIHLTGPDSHNRISSHESNHFSSNVTNNVRANNFSSQQASTGDVNVTGNTVASGGSGSGDATNHNNGSNNVNISNSSGTGGTGTGGGGSGNASISTTGPDSYNAIDRHSRTSVSENTTNNVQATNANYQSARSGDVNISRNTVAGGGGSGNATNWNSGSNTVTINNH